MAHTSLTPEQVASFQRAGVLIIKNHYDVTHEIAPIQKAIYEIIGLVAMRHGVELDRPPFTPEGFDAGFMALIAVNRSYGGEVYDIVKQIPAFLRLVSAPQNEAVFSELRKTDFAGIGAGSYGIRIDVPNEEKFRSLWHQEYLYQPQSIDGLVMWAPLVRMTPDLGPVSYCEASHLDGLRLYERGNQGKTGAYQIAIHDADKVAAGYRQRSPLTEPGDVILMDYLMIHQSGYNISSSPRWSMQSRYFNFRDPSGLKTGWKSSITTGTDVEAIFPENFVKTLP
jgi:hypothetical protein